MYYYYSFRAHSIVFTHTDLRPVECLGIGYTQPYAMHRDCIKGGGRGRAGGGGGLVTPICQRGS